MQTLPATNSRMSCGQGWNNVARHLKTKATLTFWHEMPALPQVKQASKRRYKYEVRRLKHRQSHIRRRRMVVTLASSSSRNEIKDVNRPCSQRLSHTPVVDGIRGNQILLV